MSLPVCFFYIPAKLNKFSLIEIKEFCRLIGDELPSLTDLVYNFAANRIRYKKTFELKIKIIYFFKTELVNSKTINGPT